MRRGVLFGSYGSCDHVLSHGTGASVSGARSARHESQEFVSLEDGDYCAVGEPRRGSCGRGRRGAAARAGADTLEVWNSTNHVHLEAMAACIRVAQCGIVTAGFATLPRGLPLNLGRIEQVASGAVALGGRILALGVLIRWHAQELVLLIVGGGARLTDSGRCKSGTATATCRSPKASRRRDLERRVPHTVRRMRRRRRRMRPSGGKALECPPARTFLERRSSYWA